MSERKLLVTWTVEDGYVTGSRPQHTVINENYIGMDWEEWDELNENEKNDIISQIITEEFEKKISYSIESITDTEK